MNKLLSIRELQKSKWPGLLQQTFGDNLVSAFLHGECLMEGFDALRSPWTISCILKESRAAEISAVRGLSKQAHNENIMFRHFFTPSEIVKTLDEFPLDYLHIANKSIALCGIQPFAGFIPQKDSLRRQCFRELTGASFLLRQQLANAEKAKDIVRICSETAKSVLPLLYGAYFLKTGNYPENHKQVYDMFPQLNGVPNGGNAESIEKASARFAEALDEIINGI